jgi:hypothetical protein
LYKYTAFGGGELEVTSIVTLYIIPVATDGNVMVQCRNNALNRHGRSLEGYVLMLPSYFQIPERAGYSVEVPSSSK